MTYRVNKQELSRKEFVQFSTAPPLLTCHNLKVLLDSCLEIPGAVWYNANSRWFKSSFSASFVDQASPRARQALQAADVAI